MPSGNASLNRVVRQTIYELQKMYGDEIQVYRLTAASTNYETGAKTNTKESKDIRRAAVLPASEARKFLTSISFITASKNFVSPGIQGWDQQERGFIIDARDIPGWEFDPEDWIVYRNQRYEITMIEKLEFDTGWLIIGKQTKGSVPERDIRLNVVDSLALEQNESESVV